MAKEEESWFIHIYYHIEALRVCSWEKPNSDKGGLDSSCMACMSVWESVGQEGYCRITQ